MLPLIGDFNLLVSFVTRSQQALQDAVGPTPLQPLQIPPEQFEQDRQQLQRDLDTSITDADRNGWQPQQDLLRDVKSSVDQRKSDEPRPDLAERFEQAKSRLPEEQQKLPDAFDSSLNFLRATYDAARVTNTKTGDRVAPIGETHAPQLPQAAPQAPAQDPRVKAFVERLFSDGFAPTSPQAGQPVLGEKATARPLPPELKKQLTGQPLEERRFVTSLDDRQRAAYARLAPDEQRTFRVLEPGERGQYLKMTHEERHTYEQLDPAKRAAFLLLHPDQRELVRQNAKAGLPVLPTIDAQLTELSKTEPAAAAKELAPDLVEMMGYDETKEGPTAADRAARLAALAKASTLITNHLHEKPGNLEYARLATIQDLVRQPEFQDQLISDLEDRLVQKDPTLADHMLKLRPALIDHAQAMLSPTLDRETLLAGLEQAVHVSKRFTDAYPPRRRDLRVSPRLKYFDGVRG